VALTLGGRPLVRDLSISLDPGEVIGLLGPNGAGKTTTIRMIMDIIKPDSGRLLIGNKPIQKLDYTRIGYLPEERGLYQKSKLREVLIYLAKLKNLSRSLAVSRAELWLERFGLSGYADRKIEELSKGNQQKVQFILAIIHEPRLVILDEPFSGLDPVNQLLMKEIITEMQQKGATIIFSTHQMEQVEKMCSNICLISRGRSVLHGPIRDIKRNYGNRQIMVEFKGDAARLKNIPSLNNPRFQDNIMTAGYDDSAPLNQVLADILERAEISHFEIREPSLEQIFIDQVSRGGDS